MSFAICAGSSGAPGFEPIRPRIASASMRLVAAHARSARSARPRRGAARVGSASTTSKCTDHAGRRCARCAPARRRSRRCRAASRDRRARRAGRRARPRAWRAGASSCSSKPGAPVISTAITRAGGVPTTWPMIRSATSESRPMSSSRRARGQHLGIAASHRGRAAVRRTARSMPPPRTSCVARPVTR